MVRDMFVTSIVVMISLIYTYLQTQVVYIKYVQPFIFSHTSTK